MKDVESYHPHMWINRSLQKVNNLPLIPLLRLGSKSSYYLYSFKKLCYLKKFFLTFIYFWDRERQRMNRGGSERGRPESETGSRLWAVSTEPDAGLELMDHEIMTWAEVGPLTDWAPQAPQTLTFSKVSLSLTGFDVRTYYHGALGLPTEKDGSSSAFMWAPQLFNWQFWRYMDISVKRLSFQASISSFPPFLPTSLYALY